MATPMISAYSAYYHLIHETQCFQGFAQCSPLDADLFMFRYFVSSNAQLVVIAFCVHFSAKLFLNVHNFIKLLFRL
jgi:hypothetical protein